MAYETQDYRKVAVRASAVLTNAYVANNINETLSDGTIALLDLTKYNDIVVLLGFTIGSLTSGQVKLEFSPDNVTWYQETFATISTTTSTEVNGEHSYAATGNFRFIVPMADRYCRISVKGTGTVTSSLLTVDVVLTKK